MGASCWARRMRVLIGAAAMGIILAVAALVRPASSQDTEGTVLEPQVNAWSDLATQYLVAQEGLWPIVPPSEVYAAAAGTTVKTDTLAAWQETPLWFIPFEMGVCYYGDLSPLAAEVAPGTEATVFEDLAAKEVRIFVERAEGPVEAAAFRAPPIKTTPRDGDAFFEDIQKRRVAWRVTLQPLSAAAALHEAAALRSASLALAPESMMLLMSRPPAADTNIVFFAVGPETNGMAMAVGFPAGFTNGLDLYACTDLVAAAWSVVTTNLSTSGTNEIAWVDEETTNHLIRFYAAGNATLDSDGDGLLDAREFFVHKTDPAIPDTDHDGLPDGWEHTRGFNPLFFADLLSDPDTNGVSNLEEYRSETCPQQYTSPGATGMTATLRYYYDLDDRLLDAFCGASGAASYEYTPGGNLKHQRAAGTEP